MLIAQLYLQHELGQVEWRFGKWKMWQMLKNGLKWTKTNNLDYIDEMRLSLGLSDCFYRFAAASWWASIGESCWRRERNDIYTINQSFGLKRRCEVKDTMMKSKNAFGESTEGWFVVATCHTGPETICHFRPKMSSHQLTVIVRWAGWLLSEQYDKITFLFANSQVSNLTLQSY